MKLAIGDIVKFYSPMAGKKKYHLCIYVGSKDEPYQFLFLNSGTGFKGDLVLKNEEFPYIPDSKTGFSVISCSMIIRIKENTLNSGKPEIIGQLSTTVAKKLDKFVQSTDALTEMDKKSVLESLRLFLKK